MKLRSIVNSAQLIGSYGTNKIGGSRQARGSSALKVDLRPNSNLQAPADRASVSITAGPPAWVIIAIFLPFTGLWVNTDATVVNSSRP
jgi:hypothetical protein